jgi:hypothetical protein
VKTITIVGVGALGSHVAMLLRNADAQLRVIDFDRVEQKNTQSQFHGRPHNGKLKVDSLKATMNLLWGSKLQTLSAKLVENNVDELLKGSDLVIDCLDNGAARRLVQGYVRRSPYAIPLKFVDGKAVESQGVFMLPCLHGALSAQGDFGRVVWDEKFVIDDEGAQGQATCEDGAFLPFIAIVSAYIARSAQVFLAEGEKVGFIVKPDGALRVK